MILRLRIIVSNAYALWEYEIYGGGPRMTPETVVREADVEIPDPPPGWKIESITLRKEGE